MFHPKSTRKFAAATAIVAFLLIGIAAAAQTTPERFAFIGQVSEMLGLAPTRALPQPTPPRQLDEGKIQAPDQVNTAIIAAWDFSGNNGTAATFAATTFNSNLNSSNLISRGAAATASSAANSFRTTGFKNDGISTANTDYYQVILGASPGNSVSLSSIDGLVSGTQTFVGTLGVSNQFAYSLDNGANFTLIGSPAVTTGTVPLTLPTVTLSGISALQNVSAGTTITLRYYASGQTTTGGWGFQSAAAAGTNGLAISGTVAPAGAQTPPTLASAIGATVDGPFDVTFNDDATWRGLITGITVGGNALSNTAYSVSAGKITFTPASSTLLQSTGSKSIAVQATGYSDATASQPIGPGATASYAVSAGSPQSTTNSFNTSVAAKDQYGNTVTTDSTTVVTMTSSTGNVQFDSNNDSTFGDNTKTLTSGVFSISSLDITPETMTITATGGNGKTGTSSSIVVQVPPNYRTKQSGSWSDFNTWQIDTGGGFVDATAGQTPTNLDGTVEIQGGHTVTVIANVSIDQTTVDPSGQITVNSGVTLSVANGAGTDLTVDGILNSAGSVTANGTIAFGSASKYQHNATTSAGSIPTATWDPSSTVEVLGYTTDTSGTGGLSQSFGNFTWNCPSQSGNLNVAGPTINVAGTFTVMSTGTGSLRMGSSTNAVIAATNFVQSGGTLDLSSGVGSGTIKVSGTFSQTAGTLTESGTGTADAVEFNGTSNQAATFAGTVSNTVNFTIDANAIVSLNSNVVDNGIFQINGTLNTGTSNITGTGNVVVGATGNIKGTGTISPGLTVNGALSPGNSPGILNTGNVAFGSPSNFNVDIGGNAAGTGYDQLNVTGTVNLGGAALNLAQFGGYAPQIGDSYVIVNNDGLDGVTGTFAGLAEGATVPVGFVGTGKNATISYIGGDGNDVVVNIVSTNHAPVAVGSSVSVVSGNPVTITMTGTDADNDPLTFNIPGAQANGVVTNASTPVCASGTCTSSFSYTSNPGFTGADGLRFTVNDGQATSAEANISITVTAAVCSAPVSGLKAWYRAENNANDSSGSGNNGTFDGTVAYTAGKVNQAFNLNSTDSDVKIPLSTSLNVGTGATGMTFGGWINPASTATQQALIEWNNGLGNGTGSGPFGFGAHMWLSANPTSTTPGSIYVNFLDSGNGSHVLYTAGGAVPAGSWSYVAAVYNKSTGMASIYVNGVAMPLNGGAGTQFNVGSITPQTSYDLYLGLRKSSFAVNNAGFRFAGGMDEVQLYSAALTQSDIQNIYNASTAGTCLPKQFQSAQSGDWSAISTWNESTDGGTTFHAATTFPTSSDAQVTVLNTHHITVSDAESASSVTFNSGSFLQGSGTLSVTGNISTTNATTVTGLTVVLNGNNNTQTFDGTFNNLTLDHTGSGGVINTGAPVVNNDLEIQSGPYIASGVPTLTNVQIDAAGALLQAPGQAIDVSGNWNNAGTYTATGAFVVQGNVTISGNSTFFDFSDPGTGNAITFAAGSTQTVSHSLTLQSATSLVLRSTTPGTQWNLNLQAGATQTVNKVDVQDSNASGGQAINQTNSIDSGNNTNWNFPLAPLNGTYTVGAGGAYTTLTAAVADYAARGVSGPVIFNLTDATYASETYPITVGAATGASAVNTLTIKPASGVNAAFSSSTAGSIITLNGASNVIIDGSNNGSTSRNLTLSNTNTSGAVVTFSTAVSSSTLKNAVVKGAGNNPSAAPVLLTRSNNGPISNNTIQNNLVQTSSPGVGFAEGIYMAGIGGATPSTNNVITGNTVNDAYLISIDQGGGYANTVISNNTVTTLDPVQAPTSFIFGIGVDPSGGNTTTIVGNRIFDLNPNAANAAIAGIVDNTGVGDTVIAENNFVSLDAGVNHPSTQMVYGIYHRLGTGTFKVYDNSVRIGGSGVTTSNRSAGLDLEGGAGATADVKNNIFYNARSNGTGAEKIYGIYVSTAEIAGTTSDYNDIAGVIFGNDGTADRANLAAWTAAHPTFDVHSVSGDPVFTSATDLHITNGASPVKNIGTPIAGITTDIDGDTRNATTPDIGADEFTAPFINFANTTPLVFGNTAVGGSSAAMTRTFTASDLSAGISCSSGTTDFQVSSDGVTFGSSATFNQSGGIASGTLSVRFTPQATGGRNASITCSSTGAPDAVISAIGTGVAAFTVTYNGNGNTGGTAPTDANSPYASGSTVTVLGPGTLVKTSFQFKNWNTAANGSGTAYNTGDTFAITTATTLFAQWQTPVYTWTGAASTDYQVAVNWSPNRTTPASNDVLQFNNGAADSVTNVPTQTIGQLLVSNNTPVTLQAATTGTTLTIGAAGSSLSVGAGSQLNASGANTLTFNIPTGSTASISGSMDFAGGSHKLTAADASGITFNNGSVFTADTGSGINQFGSAGTPSSVVFANGSRFVENTTNPNPFGTQPASVVVFQTGSLYKVLDSSGFFTQVDGRVFADIEIASAAAANPDMGSSSGSHPITFDNLTVTSGKPLWLVGRLTGGGDTVHGNVTIAPGAAITLEGQFGPLCQINFAGSVAQTFSNSGTESVLNAPVNFNVNNSAGLGITGPLNITAVNLTTGNLNVNAASSVVTNTLTTNGNIVTGAGDFSANAYNVSSAAGLSASGATGDVQITGTRGFSNTFTYNYVGGIDQNIGTGIPSPFGGVLRINDPGHTVTLDRTISHTSGQLFVTGGTFATGTNLTVGAVQIVMNGGLMTGTLQGGGQSVAYGFTGLFGGSGSSATTGIELTGTGVSSITEQLTDNTQTITLGSDLTLGPGSTLSTVVGNFATGAHKLISNGTLVDNGNGSQLVVSNGGTLGGTATSNIPTTVQMGGTLAPGNSPGTITISNLSMSPGSTLAEEIASASSFDKIVVPSTGTAPNLGGANLNLINAGAPFTPSPGQSFTIIDNQTAGAITTTFAGLPEGATINNFLGIAGQSANITYKGGTGNDVVITTPFPSISVPATVDFGTVTLGNTGTQTITVQNTGGAPLNITNISISGGNHAADYALVSTLAGQQVAAQSSKTFQVAFDPTTTSPAETTNVTITSDDPNNGSTVIGLTGLGQAAVCTAPVSSLVSWYKGEGDATDATTANNGTVQGAGFAAGKVGQGFTFNGGASAVSIPDSPTFALTQSLTLDAWVNVTAYPASGHQGMIVFRGDGRPFLDPYYLSVTETGTARFHIEDASGTIVNVEAPIGLNQLVHVAGVLDGSTGTMTLYLNGVDAAHTTTATRPFDALDVNQSPGLGIGNLEAGTSLDQGFNGLIDEVQVYNTALSSGQVQAIYNSSTAGDCSTPTISVTDNATPVANNSTDGYPDTMVFGTSSKTFTIKNTGSAIMSVGTITLDGTNASSFTLNTAGTATSLTSGQTTTFTVTFNPTTFVNGLTAAVHIPNGDTNANPFNITLTGNGTATSATTYVWTPAIGQTEWTLATNWASQPGGNPRLTPNIGDTLIVDGTVTSAPTITNVPTETDAKLRVINGAKASISATVGSAVLTLTDSSSALFIEQTGASLTLTGSQAIKLSLPTGAKGVVNSALTLDGVSKSLVATDASAVIFGPGATATTTSTFTGNPFGTGAAGDGGVGSIVFLPASGYFHNGGSSPFGNSANPAVIAFLPGSQATFLTATGFEADGRTYADLVIGAIDPSGVTVNISQTGTGSFSFDNLTVRSTNLANSSLQYAGTGASAVTIRTGIRSEGMGLNNQPDVTLSAGTGGIQMPNGATFNDDGSNGGNGRPVEFDSDATVPAGKTLTLRRKVRMGASADKTLNIANTAILDYDLLPSSYYVIGNLQRNFVNGVARPQQENQPDLIAQDAVYPVGTATASAPVSLTTTSGTGSLSVKAVDGVQPQTSSPGHALHRYWTLNGTGITTDLKFQYAAADVPVTATESAFNLYRFDSPTFTQVPATIDTIGHTATAAAISTFSDWTLAEPIATVSPATHFAVTVPGSAQAGVPFNFMVQALDQFNAPTSGYNGTVHFTSSDAAATLPTDIVVAGGTGTFAATLKTLGSQTLTATDTVTSTMTGTSGPIVVTAGPATHLSISASSPVTAGTSFSFIATALDQFNNVATGYTGTVHFIKTDAGAGSSVPADYAFVAGDNGVHTFTNGATLVTAGNQTITGTDTVTALITGTSGTIMVTPAAATHFTLSAPASTPAGSPFTVTVSAFDQFGNAATGYAGTVHFTKTDNGAGSAVPANYTFLAGDNGVHTFTNGATLVTAGNQTITATDTVTSITGSSATTVNAGPATQLLVTGPAGATAGTAFNVTVSAKDQFGNVSTGYTGTVHFTKSDAGAGSAVPANYTYLAGDNGVHTFTSGATLVTAGNQTITATDTVTPSITGTSGPILVTPAAVTHFTVSAPGNATAGSAFNVTVTALDQFGNTATGYTGTVHFTKTDSGAGSAVPANYTFLAGDNGVHTFVSGATLVTAGVQTITATDTVTGAITGTTGSIAVSAAAATHFLVNAPGAATAGSAFNFIVTAVDQFGNTATGYSGTVHFTSTDAQAVLPANSTLTTGAGTFAATLKTAGIRTITVTDSVNGSVSGTSTSIAVTASAATQLVVTQQPSATATAGIAFTTQPVVSLEDAFGNVVTSDSTHMVTASRGSHGTATLQGAAQTVTLVNGVATFSGLSYNKAETTNILFMTTAGAFTATSNDIVVSGAAATHYTVVAPGTATAGTAFNITVTALDQFGNTAPGYAGNVHFTSTDAQAVLPANSTLSSGVGTFGTTLKTAGLQTLTATDTVNGSITGTSNSVAVSAGAATHFLVAGPGAATAGSAFSVTLSAVDQFGNTATGYTGTVHFTKTDSGAGSVVPANYTFVAADNGVHLFSGGATLVTAGNQTITATDTGNGSITGTSGQIVVLAAAATHFGVVAPGAATSGTPFNFTVTALDQFGNTATAYAGTVHFTSTDGSAALPANSTLASGTKTFSATLSSGGNQTITATDTVNIPITGTSGTIVITNGTTTTTVTSSPNPSVYGQSVIFNATVTSNTGTPTGSVSFIDNGTPITGCQNVVLAAGTASCSTSGLAVGSHNIIVNYTPTGTFVPSSGSVAQTVNKAATTTTITNIAALGTASLVNQAYAVKWTVTANAPGAGTPTGTVTVSDGTATCTASVAAGTCDLTSTTVGTKSITAVYSGDGNFLTSSSSVATHVVNLQITGNVKQYNAPNPNTNLSGVTLTLSGCTGGPAVTTTTDASGNYTFAGQFSGTCVVTPSGLGKVYDPTSRTIASVVDNLSGTDFIAYNPNAVPRIVSIVNSYAAPGHPVTVAVLLASQGNESTLKFSLSYDVNPFSGLPTVACGADAGANCLLTVDSSQQGKLGITVRPQNAPFAPGQREVVRVTLQTLQTTLYNTPIKFGTTPVNEQTLDPAANPLPTAYADGFVVFQQGMEGDVASRSMGDGQLLSNDVTIERQFVVGTMTPDPTFNEFQRADTAPKGTAGDGALNAADVIQVRRYVLGLDAPAGAGGAFFTGGAVAPPAQDSNRATPAGRALKVTSTNAVAGSKVSVDVTLDAAGNETAASFDVGFDAMKLSNPTVTLGGGAPADTTLTVNTADSNTGRIRVLIDSSNSFEKADAKQVVTITFDVAGSAPTGDTEVSLSNGSLSDTEATDIPVSYTSGKVTIGGPNAVGITVSGKVTTPEGAGLRNAAVTLTDAQGNVRTTLTGNLGFYSFDTVPTGREYTITVTSKRYRFASRRIQPAGSLADVDLTAVE